MKTLNNEFEAKKNVKMRCGIEFRRKEISWLKRFESEYNEVNAFEDNEI